MINTFGKPPMAHRIRIPRPYEPSFATDIKGTFARERRRLEREAFAGVQAVATCREDCPSDFMPGFRR